MGIDVYMHWHEQSEEEKDAQFTGFSVVSGNAGYLREAYHGGPYVTHYLVAEAFEDHNHEDGPQISAAVMRSRLPVAVSLSLLRAATVYGEDSCPGVINIDNEGLDSVMEMVKGALAEAERVGTTAGETESVALEGMPDGLLDAVSSKIVSRDLPDYALSFVDFVELAERKEKELGKPVRVYASY